MLKRWLPFEWIVAIRFLREGRSQTLFIISGIAIGVGVIVFMSALLAGLEANFIKRVLTSQSQIQILPPQQVARPLRNARGEFEDATIQRPTQRFPVQLAYINTGVNATTGAVEVKLDVAAPSAVLKQDMTVSVDIEVATSNNALVLPVRSVHDLLSGQPWVLGIKDGRAAKRTVKVGLHGNSHIEILEGMAETEVAIPSNSGILTGQRVRAVLP